MNSVLREPLPEIVKHRLAIRYGPEILTDFEDVKTKPFYNLTGLSNKYGFSRQYANQTFKRIYKAPYKKFLIKKNAKVKADTKLLKTHCNPKTKVATYLSGLRKDGAKVELMAANECKAFGFEVQYEPIGKCIDLLVNGKLVEVKSRKTVSKASRTSYYNFTIEKNQLEKADFFICYIEPTETFYIIPNNKKSVSIYIPSKKSKYKGRSEHWILQYKEAWHLLK